MMTLLEGIKIDQVAIATDDAEKTRELFKSLGLTKWIKDNVVALGTVFGQPNCMNGAILNFNYDMGIEFEILEYTTGSCWHDKRLAEGKSFPFISHIGSHIESEEKLQSIMKVAKDLGIEIAQEVFTKSHTNEYLKEKKRKYHYVIFDTNGLIGFDLKLIVRRENES